MPVYLSAACLYISVYTPVRSPVCLSVCHTSVFCRQSTPLNIIRNFYRTTHMHSADYAVATCLSDHSSLCLSDSPSVCHTTDLPPCTGRKNTDIYGINCPYIMFTAMCPYVCLPLLYVPFVHFYDCLPIYVSLCMSIFMYSCLSVCLLHSCAILSIHVYVSSCPFV